MQFCGFNVGLNRPFFLIAGPCVIESEAMCVDIAGAMKEITGELGIPYVFKASFDKANRTSDRSFRGLGMEEGLRILERVRALVGVPVLTDVHTEAEVPVVARSVDALQTPAFLCRQTDFIRACAQSGLPVNIKKGQFLAPGDMKNVVEKARHAAVEAGLSPDRFCVCERGASFGYGNLVSDMRGLAIMRETQAPVVFDATHSVQLPGGNGASSGGQRQFVPVLARAAAAAGVAGFFMETHPNPACAKSDGPNLVPLRHMRELLETLLEIDRALPERLELVRQTDEEIETLVDGLRIIEEAFRPGASDGSTNPHDDELVRKVLEAQAILAESAGAVPAGPDLRNIPDEEAASADPKLMDVRLRLLARFDDVRRRRLLLVEAMRDAAAVLQKYRREGVIETAAAQAVLAKAKRAASAARTVQSPDV